MVTRPLRAVLYDLDGVLIESRATWYQVILDAARHYGRPPIERDHFYGTFGQGIRRDVEQFFPMATEGELTRLYHERMLARAHEVDFIEHALETLEAVGSLGVAQAIVTNTPVDLAREILGRTGIRSRVDAFAAAGEAPEKPAPDLVRLALARLGARADEAIYVGDSPTDVAAARAAAIEMVGYRIDADLRIEGLPELAEFVRRRLESR